MKSEVTLNGTESVEETPEKKGGKKDTRRQRTAPRCEDCGFKIHGPNHAEGPHHRMGKGGHAKISLK